MLLVRNIELSPVTAYTVKQAAELLGVSVATVHNYITDGKRVTQDRRCYLTKESGYISKDNLVQFIKDTRPSSHL